MLTVKIVGKEKGRTLKLKASQNLSEIRKEITKKRVVDQPFFFCYEENEIVESEEAEIKLEEILINNKEFYIQLKEDNIISNNQTKIDKPIKKNNPIPEAKLLKNQEKGGLKIFKYPSQKFDDYDESRALIMLVVGETGSGKTTLLNCLVNYLLGIQFIDDFRYKIIIEDFKHSQAQSMTEEVNIYNIKPINGLPPIKIIDTPGFGDTRGIEYDQIIRNRIEEVFRKELTTINGICFLAKCSNPRLTASQKYIFSSILDLFGNDVAENFVFLLTFCDGSQPVIFDALKEEETVSQKIIPTVKQRSKNWYYTFNNNSIFNSDRNEMTKMFYESTMKSFKDFCEHLRRIKPKSLTQSKEVIQQRKELEDSIVSLKDSLRHCLNKMDELNKMEETVKNLKGDVNSNSDFLIKAKVSEPKKKKDDSFLAANNVCLECKHTCHSDCWNKFKKFNSWCHVFENKKCTVCPKHCGVDSHELVDYYFQYVEEEKEIKISDLKDKYCNSLKGVTDEKEAILKGLEEDYNKEKDLCICIQESITNNLNELTQKALNRVNLEGSEQYIKLMIKEEEREMKEGFEGRIKSLEKLLNAYQTLRAAYEEEMQRKEGKQKKSFKESITELVKKLNASEREK